MRGRSSRPPPRSERPRGRPSDRPGGDRLVGEDLLLLVVRGGRGSGRGRSDGGDGSRRLGDGRGRRDDDLVDGDLGGGVGEERVGLVRRGDLVLCPVAKIAGGGLEEHHDRRGRSRCPACSRPASGRAGRGAPAPSRRGWRGGRSGRGHEVVVLPRDAARTPPARAFMCWVDCRFERFRGPSAGRYVSGRVGGPDLRRERGGYRSAYIRRPCPLAPGVEARRLAAPALPEARIRPHRARRAGGPGILLTRSGTPRRTGEPRDSDGHAKKAARHARRDGASQRPGARRLASRGAARDAPGVARVRPRGPRCAPRRRCVRLLAPRARPRASPVRSRLGRHRPRHRPRAPVVRAAPDVVVVPFTGAAIDVRPGEVLRVVPVSAPRFASSSTGSSSRRATAARRCANPPGGRSRRPSSPRASFSSPP